MQQRNRNGDSRNKDDDTPPREIEEAATDLKAPDAPARRPEAAPPAVAPARRLGGGPRRVLLLVVVAAAAALLYHYWGFWKGEQAAATAPPPPPVTASKPLIKDMQEWSDFTGQFEAREAVEVRPRVSGYLESINFVDGQLVKKGDLLFVIEPRPFELALETAKAQQAQAQAQLDLAKAQLERTA
ncbi:MAG: efflux RND transporter periplasmic adaptor subunit, partial [Methyloceanibacter sp.]